MALPVNPLRGLPRPLKDLMPGPGVAVPPASQLLPTIPAPAVTAKQAEDKRLSQITGLPVIATVWQKASNNLSGQPGDAFAWPRAGPLAVYIENTQDVAVVVDLHGGMTEDTSRILQTPIRSVSMGAQSRRLITLNPGAGDDWSPWIWPVVTPNSLPTSGNLRIQFSRPGI